MKLDRDSLAAKSLGITHTDDPSRYISPQVDIHFMIRTAETLINNEHKPFPFHADFLYSLAKALADDIHARHLQQNNESVPNFALLLVRKV